MQQQGTIVRWDADKGYGFIQSPQSDQQVFFHFRDVRAHPQELNVGLGVRYETIHIGGKGPRAMAVTLVNRNGAASTRRQTTTRPPTSRPPAQATAWQRWSRPSTAQARRALDRSPEARQRQAPAGPALLMMLAYAGALAWGVWHRQLPVAMLLAAPLLNALTFWIYWGDKHAARTGAWRTREDSLHLLSLTGGWIGAWWGQRLLRHKSRKASFQQTYWATVVLHWAALIGWLLWSQPVLHP